MRRVWIGVAGLLLLGALQSPAQTRLNPGQLAIRNLPQALQAVLYNGDDGFYVDIPADATRVVVELSTSPPDGIVDLYARYNEDVRVTAANTVLADYRSENVGGSERIEIVPGSAPPLQPARLFLAVRSGPESFETTTFLSVEIDTLIVSDAIEIVGSDFATGEDHWQRNYPAPALEVPGSTLGTPTSVLRTARDPDVGIGRYLELQSKGENDYFVVGRQFLGNLALLGDESRIEFDLRYRPPQSFANQEIEVKIFSRFTAYRWSGGRPKTEFEHYSIFLHPSAWQRISGSDSFEKALENVLRIEIRANYGQIDGVTGIDNFTLFGRAKAPLAPLQTNFDTSLGGWVRNYPEAPFLTPRSFGVTTGDQDTVIRIINTDGNPGGFLQITDSDDDVNQDFMVAPSQYLGDLSSLGPNTAFEVDRRHASALGATRPVEIRIIGFGAAYRFFGPLPGPTWPPTRFRAPLDPDLWTLIEGDRSFEQVVRAVQRIEVSVDDVLGDEISGLDNFRLEGSPSQVPVLSAAPDRLSFVSVLGGSVPAAEIIEISTDGENTTWTAQVTGGSAWVVLERTEGVTPGALVVRADPAGLGRGTYTDTVEVEWPNAPESVMINVRLTVINPTTPRLASGGVVNNATFLPNSLPGGELTGGMFVALFGENFSTGTVLADSVPFPTALAGTSATMGGLPMALVYVSPTQLVGVVPQALTQPTGVAQSAPQTSADVIVTHNGDASPIETVRLKPVQPLIFTQNQAGTGLGAIQNVLAGGLVQLNTFDTPAQPGQAITIFATGLGPTETPVPDGFPATGANAVTGVPRVTIGGLIEIPLFAGLSPNSPHLYQVNATVPEDSPTGCAVPLRISIDGVSSNEVTLAVTSDGSPCR